ncbi:hypothetical protein BD769DRAFT_1672085 [Suillus cothurnatus]|nr:hypothetical protein BD769DRAFT_1672085 [Suillus cothurnatus]
MRHESESPSVSTALQRANKEKRTHCMSATQYGGTVALNGHGTEFARVVNVEKTTKKKGYLNATAPHATLTVTELDEQKESESIKPEPDQLGSEAMVQARTSCTRATAARQTHKRKIGDVDGNQDIDKENRDVLLKPALVVKRICWEKTGTDWQTVLDIIKYGDEQREAST